MLFTLHYTAFAALDANLHDHIGHGTTASVTCGAGTANVRAIHANLDARQHRFLSICHRFQARLNTVFAVNDAV